jgi:hypothetical protein
MIGRILATRHSQGRKSARGPCSAIVSVGAAFLVAAAGLVARAETEPPSSAAPPRPASVSSFVKQRFDAVGKALRGGWRIGRGAVDQRDGAETHLEAGQPPGTNGSARLSPRRGIARALPNAVESDPSPPSPTQTVPASLPTESQWQEVRITDTTTELPSLDRALLKQQEMTPDSPAVKPDLAAEIPSVEVRVTSFDPQSAGTGVRRVRVLPAQEIAQPAPEPGASAEPAEALPPPETAVPSAATPAPLAAQAAPPQGASDLAAQAAVPRSTPARLTPAIDTRAALLDFLSQAATADATPAEAPTASEAQALGEPRPVDPPAGAELAPPSPTPAAQSESPAESP